MSIFKKLGTGIGNIKIINDEKPDLFNKVKIK